MAYNTGKDALLPGSSKRIQVKSGHSIRTIRAPFHWCRPMPRTAFASREHLLFGHAHHAVVLAIFAAARRQVGFVGSGASKKRSCYEKPHSKQQQYGKYFAQYTD
jgi:hypothetical protein